MLIVGVDPLLFSVEDQRGSRAGVTQLHRGGQPVFEKLQTGPAVATGRGSGRQTGARTFRRLCHSLENNEATSFRMKLLVSMVGRLLRDRTLRLADAGEAFQRLVGAGRSLRANKDMQYNRIVTNWTETAALVGKKFAAVCRADHFARIALVTSEKGAAAHFQKRAAAPSRLVTVAPLCRAVANESVPPDAGPAPNRGFFTRHQCRPADSSRSSRGPGGPTQ